MTEREERNRQLLRDLQSACDEFKNAVVEDEGVFIDTSSLSDAERDELARVLDESQVVPDEFLEEPVDHRRLREGILEVLSKRAGDAREGFPETLV